MADSTLVLFVNGKAVDTSKANLFDPLVSFIRDVVGLKGTKNNCAYGDTGASNVIMSSWCSTEQKFLHRTISAACTLLGSCHGTNITTVEGIGNQARPHPVQTRLAECHAIQCGFDSPGTVVSMYGLLLNKAQPTMGEIEAAQVGNLSRCSGYRAVLEAFKVFTEKPNPEELATHEAKLPSALKDSLPMVLRAGTAEWHYVSHHSSVKALQKKEKNWVVVYGLLTGQQAEGKNVVIDVSRCMEKRAAYNKSGLEVAAQTTVAGLADRLESLEANQESQMTKELVHVLRSVQTPQWRNSTGLGDALTCNKEVQVALLAAGAKLVATPALSGVQSERTLELEDVVANIPGYTITALVLPSQAPKSHLLFCRVGARKANAAEITCAALNVSLDGKAISSARMFMGRTNNGVGTSKLNMGVLKGKKLKHMGKWSGEIEKISSDKMTQNLVFKLLQDLSTHAMGSPAEKAKLQEQRWPTRSTIETTQFSVVTEVDASSTSPLGEPVPMVTGLVLATGEATFVDDMPKMSNELFMAPVLSTVAHAKLLSVDPSTALSLPGVVRFLDFKDVPDSLVPFKVQANMDEEIFAKDEVLYEGHPIGAIVARNEAVARKAAALVKIEYEILKPIVTIDDAIEANSYIDVDENTTVTSFDVGNVEAAFATSDAVVKGSIETTRQEHFYEETMVALVVPIGEDDEYKIYHPTPNILYAQHMVAKFLGVPFNRVLVESKRVGCNYGGKITRFIPLLIATALAAKLTKKPVRCQLTSMQALVGWQHHIPSSQVEVGFPINSIHHLDQGPQKSPLIISLRDEDIRIMGQRGEFRGEYRLGVTKGKITGADYRLYKNAGFNSDASPGVVATAMVHLDNSYEFPTFRVDSKVCKTNTPSNTAFRAFGAPPAMTITENMIYDACVELKMDPLQFRRDNLQRVGWENHYGQVMVESDVGMTACLDEVVKRCDYHNLKQQVEDFNAKNKWRKRGIYILPNKYGIGIPAMFAHNGCLVHIYLDGSVLISHGGIEMGQGLHTKMLQVVSTELGVPMNRIRVADTSNDKVPNGIPTGGSSGADLNGNALRDACQQIMARLAPIRAAAGGEKAPWEMVVGMAFGSRINLSAVGYWAVPTEQGIDFDPVKKKGKRWCYYTVSAACSVVEIDVLTGQHTLLSTEMVVDVGQAINPAIDIAQIEAAFIQGYGWISMENTTFSPEGKLQTRGHSEYNIPSVADCPLKFNVSLLKSKVRQQLLYSSKGVGEPPFFNGVSVYFAIKEAVRAARQDVGLTGTFSLCQPTTPENVLKACQARPLSIKP